LWPPDEVTLAEAVAVNSPAEVARLLAEGADPNAPSAVRPELLNTRRRVFRPLEVAVLERLPTPAALLIDAGATLSPAEIQDLWCGDRGAPPPEIAAALEPLLRDGPPRCP
jgi:hypothetical protein